MGDKSLRVIGSAVCCCLLMLGVGCPFAADAFNPDFLTSLGIASGSGGAGSGKVLIAFTNDSQFDAAFAATTLASLTPEALADAIQFDAVVGAGANRTFAADCPVNFVIPGGSASSAGVSASSVLVTGATETFTLTFTGAALESGRDYICGDVVEMRLSQVGAGAAVEDFILQVRVLPGR